MQTCHVLCMFALDWATETVHLQAFLHHSFSRLKDMYKTYSSQIDSILRRKLEVEMQCRSCNAEACSVVRRSVVQCK